MQNATPHQLNRSETHKLLNSIRIPPQPEVVRALIEERNNDDPDIARIVHLIANDVGLAAAVLKAVNSPFYGLRQKVSSIQNAVSILGLKNIGTLVMGLALRASVNVEGIEAFWRSAGRVAQLANLLARRFALTQTQEAHLYGLFHDAAIPLLQQSIADYRQTLHEAEATDWAQFTQIEDARHQTNHAVVGGLLASNWGLPENLRDAIKFHHDASIFEDSNIPQEVKNLVAIGHVAEKLDVMLSKSMNDCEWEEFGDVCRQYLGLGEDEFLDIKDEAMDFFGAGDY